MRRLLFAAVLALLIAPASYACEGCIWPPPGDKPTCGEVICGNDFCTLEFGTGFVSCSGTGPSCSENGRFCAKQQEPPPPPPSWVNVTPFSNRWRLVAVKTEQPRAKTQRG